MKKPSTNPFWDREVTELRTQLGAVHAQLEWYQSVTPGLLACLKAAERFMSGFEDDDMQDPPVNNRLRCMRKAIANAEPKKEVTK